MEIQICTLEVYLSVCDPIRAGVSVIEVNAHNTGKGKRTQSLMCVKVSVGPKGVGSKTLIQ